MLSSATLVRASLAVFLSGAFCLAQGVTSKVPAKMDSGRPGTRVDPATYGSSVVESMQTVIERQRTRGPESKILHGARNGAQGSWVIPSRRAHPEAHSAPHAVINKWGDTCMGIGFGRRVDFEGAWFAGQGAQGVWTNGIRIVGFRASVEVARTEWFEEVQRVPSWFAAGLKDVDRIEIHSRAVHDGGGWYSLDDLTYRLPAGERKGEQEPAPIVVDFDDLTYRKTLTGTHYAGLDWQNGTGPFAVVSGRGSGGVGVVPAPKSPVSGSRPGRPDSGGAPRLAFAQNKGTAPNLIKSYVGSKLGDPGGGWVPPDTCGACGIDHFVSVVNMNFSVFRKTDGARIMSVAHSVFWGSNVGDPRIVFDPDSRRFFQVGMDGPTGNVYLAVSLTSDPTGRWFKTSWKAGIGSDAGTWPDFPTLGVDKRGVYMAALMVGRSTITIWAMHKAPLLQAAPKLGTVTAWRGLPWEGAIQPCVTHGDDGGCYLVSRRNTNNLHVLRIEGPLATTPKLRDRGLVAVPYHVSGPNAPALGSRINLSTGDFRPSFAVYRKGSIWVAQTVAVNGRSACRWYEINTKNMRAKQVGTVQHVKRHYFYPSISVNARGDVAMAFSGSHAGEYAGAWFTGRLAGDPPGEMGTPQLLKAGLAAYNIVTGNGVVRWGDYSATTVDPVDDRTFWTIQEYARRDTWGNGIWGTRIGRLDFAWFGYGAGWPGTNGVPELSMDGLPYLGTAPVIKIGNSRGAATTVWLAVGAAPANIPLLDGTLLLLPLVTVSFGLPGAGLSLPASIPNDPTLLQRSLYLQAVVADPGASRGLAFSRGLEARIGK